jgi:hypothetical protein
MRFIQPISICVALATRALGWVHPGILHSTADLARVKAYVAAETQPWYEAYQAFAADSHSSLSYSFTSACPVVTRDKTASLIVCMDQFASDSVAARQLALMWAITGTASYATKATTILSSWGSTLTIVNGSSLLTFLLNFLY